MSLINETNQQYYRGSQEFTADGQQASFTVTFDTELKNSVPAVSFANYAVYTKFYSAPWVKLTEGVDYNLVSGNTISFTSTPAAGTSIAVQLARLDGGDYGTGNDGIYGNAVEENYGSYEYIKLDDIINNFIVAYVGPGKLIPSVKKSDVLFHAKRGLQEFSYDTLKSIKSQELSIPNSLSIIIPQDYVNYVKMSWIDLSGVKHIIYPTTLTSNPYESPEQDSNGIPEQDEFGNNIESNSITESRWANNDLKNIDSLESNSFYGYPNFDSGDALSYGQLYGTNPETANANGWFTINKRENKISFSANLVNKIIIFEYISDGLAYDKDTKVPKLAEEAMYAHLSYSILAGRANQPEYVVRRLKQDRSAKLRNTKIRLSNIKLSEITQVMRGKSKQIKH